MNSAGLVFVLGMIAAKEVSAWELTPSLSPACNITFGGVTKLYSHGFPELHSRQTFNAALPSCKISDDPRTTSDWKQTILSNGWTSCIMSQLCNPVNPIYPLADRAGCLIACYRDCAVTTASWEHCQGHAFGGVLNTAAQLQTTLCNQLSLPTFPAKFQNYTGCLFRELTTDLQSQVIQVNHCQARCVGMLFDW